MFSFIKNIVYFTKLNYTTYFLKIFYSKKTNIILSIKIVLELVRAARVISIVTFHNWMNCFVFTQNWNLSSYRNLLAISNLLLTSSTHPSMVWTFLSSSSTLSFSLSLTTSILLPSSWLFSSIDSLIDDGRTNEQIEVE